MTQMLTTLAPPQPHHRRDTDLQDRAAFYLTGHRGGSSLAAADGLALVPAAFAPFLPLHDLRHDYPVVLVDNVPALQSVVSISGLVDAWLEAVPRDLAGERIRHRALEVEQLIRESALDGPASLAEAWRSALAAFDDGSDPSLTDAMTRFVQPAATGGEIVDCHRDTPRDVLGHIWSAVQRERVDKLAHRIARLRAALEDILAAEQANTPAGLAADRLGRSVGPVFAGELDLPALSCLLTTNRPAFALSDARRARIRGLLQVLESQRFVTMPGERRPGEGNHSFSFTSARAAISAYHERYPELNALAKALVMADLEADGRYHEETHDALFARWSVADIDEDTLAVFPHYFVHLRSEEASAADGVELIEALAEGLPLKVVVHVDDLVELPHPDRDRSRVGLSARSLTHAMLLDGSAFVLQAPSSHLYKLRAQLVRGFEVSGPSVFVVYTGAGKGMSSLPAYLVSSAALESRVFPLFVFDPSAGTTWAQRFSLDGNPCVADDWCHHVLATEDAALHPIRLTIPFTAGDFFAADAQLARDIALASEDPDERVVPFIDHLAVDCGACADSLPYVLMCDAEGFVHRVLVDRKLIDLGRRVQQRWHSLQELGGVHNSYAARAVADAQAEWAAAQTPLSVTPQPDQPVEPDEAPAPSIEAQEEASAPNAPNTRDPDQAWIDTPRCSTCNECTTINDRMFRYNDDRQAYIADVTAGSFAQLVEAAENCQVAIIHPGKPVNLDEPGLPELILRAEALG